MAGGTAVGETGAQRRVGLDIANAVIGPWS
jgi:hypothetical protein